MSRTEPLRPSPTDPADPAPTGARAAARAALELAERARREGRHREGVALAAHAVALARAAGQPAPLAAALGCNALHHLRLGDCEASLACAHEALPLLQREREDAALGAELLCTMTMAYNELGLHAEALEHVMLALEAAGRSGSDSLLSWALNRAGVTYKCLGQPEESLRFLHQALDVARAIDGEEESFSALNNLASNHCEAAERAAERGDDARCVALAELAIRHAVEALAMAEASGNLHRVAVCHINLHRAWLQRRVFEPSIRHLGCCEEVALANGFRSLSLWAAGGRGAIRRAQGDLDGAVACYEDALAQARAIEERDREHEFHGELYRIHKARGDFARALAHHEALLELDRAQARQRADVRTRLLIGRMDVELARAEATRATLHAEVQRLRAERLAGEVETLSAQARELGRQAEEDALTGLANRRRVDEELARRLRRPAAAGRTLCVAALDLDHFKQVNDGFGHATGDDVLRAVAELLRGHMREGDLVARVGGEEFVALLDTASLAAAAEVCDRVRAAVQARDWAGVAAGLSVTVSVGVCEAAGAADARALLARADAALYAAKRGGRNRVVVG
jgi:diguanylate cyclase (GGDEF)-like protein